MKWNYERFLKFINTFRFPLDFKMSTIDIKEYLKRSGEYDIHRFFYVIKLFKINNLFSNSPFLTEYKIDKMKIYFLEFNNELIRIKTKKFIFDEQKNIKNFNTNNNQENLLIKDKKIINNESTFELILKEDKNRIEFGKLIESDNNSININFLKQNITDSIFDNELEKSLLSSSNKKDKKRINFLRYKKNDFKEELRSKSVEELIKQNKNHRDELSKFKSQLTIENLEQSHRIVELRKKIACIEVILTERKLFAEAINKSLNLNYFDYAKKELHRKQQKIIEHLEWEKKESNERIDQNLIAITMENISTDKVKVEKTNELFRSENTFESKINQETLEKPMKFVENEIIDDVFGFLESGIKKDIFDICNNNGEIKKTFILKSKETSFFLKEETFKGGKKKVPELFKLLYFEKIHEVLKFIDLYLMKCTEIININEILYILSLNVELNELYEFEEIESILHEHILEKKYFKTNYPLYFKNYTFDDKLNRINLEMEQQCYPQWVLKQRHFWLNTRNRK